MDRKLLEYKGKVYSSPLAWDHLKFPLLKTHIPFINSPELIIIVENLFKEYEEKQDKLAELPKSLIHNDPNDTNTLLTLENPCVLAYIDLGDILYTSTINDLAVASVYYLFPFTDRLLALEQIVRGFNMVFPIKPIELELFGLLMRIRLATSLLMSSFSFAKNPGNPYILSSQDSVISLLLYFTKEIDENTLLYRLRRACSYKFYCPQEETLLSYLKTSSFSPLFKGFSLKDYHALDLSITSDFLKAFPQCPISQGVYIKDYLASKGKVIGIGRYNEERGFYTSENFKEKASIEARTVHLGMDFFIKAGTPIYSPLQGKVHSFGDAMIPLDYGPVIIIENQIKELKFYTLFGHLSRESLIGLYKGKIFEEGDIIGYIGDPTVNGNWAPHLHFQLINDMFGEEGNYIGVCQKGLRDLWLSICPNPNLLLKLPLETIEIGDITKEIILKERKEHLATSLSISYENPLFLVKGSMQFLFDEENSMYLDGVNNVAHIGHCNPKLIPSIIDQFSLLNTNTRYLSSELAEYTKELLKTFPSDLNVLFLTNSGSEANDLALRLARNYTKRKDIIVLNHAYHGNLTSLIEISPYKFNNKGGFPCPPYVHIAQTPDLYRPPSQLSSLSEPQLTEAFSLDIKRILEENKGKISCFIAESLLGCGGQIPLPKGYLKAVYQWVRNEQGVCIADEVQVGFGRIGSHFWGFEAQDVVPDIVTMGKPIGNGFPIGAVVTTKEIAEAFDNGMEYFNTFGGSNVACRIGLGVLKVIKEDSLQRNAWFLGEVLLEGFNRLKEDFHLIGDVRGLGMFIGIELVKERKSKEPAFEEANWIVEYLKREEKVLISVDGPFHNVLKIKPPLCWNIGDCGRLIMGVRRALEEIIKRV